MRNLFSILLFNCFCVSAFSQVDTIPLKKIITNLNTEREHIEFWEYIHNRDQELGSRLDKETIDQEDLIMVSYYLNLFGYPDQKILGQKSSIMTTIWVHIASYEISKMTFPIILQAYLKKTISEKDMREYFVRILYKRYYDDNGNWTKPLGEIYKDLDVNVSTKINLPALVAAIESWNEFMNMERNMIGTWKSENTITEFYLHGKKISKEIEGVKVMFYSIDDGRIFFNQVYEHDISDPMELEILNEKDKTYKEKYRVSAKYYRITPNGDLEWRDSGKVKNLYMRI